MPKVAIVMGSKSDLAVVKAGVDILKSLSIDVARYGSSQPIERLFRQRTSP